MSRARTFWENTIKLCILRQNREPSGCPDCFRKADSKVKMKPSAIFIEDARAVHREWYKYVENTYDGARQNMQIICRKHGLFHHTTDAPNSGSQTSISHFFSVSNPEYCAGWNKILGNSELEWAPPEKLTKYDQRTALVSEEWRNYKETKDLKHLSIVCGELPLLVI